MPSVFLFWAVSIFLERRRKVFDRFFFAHLLSKKTSTRDKDTFKLLIINKLVFNAPFPIGIPRMERRG
jgi:hypothetical protein